MCPQARLFLEILSRLSILRLGDRAAPSIPSPRVATKRENAGPNGGLRSAVEVAQVETGNSGWRSMGNGGVGSLKNQIPMSSTAHLQLKSEIAHI